MVLTTTFIILQNGLYIDSLSLPNIKVKQLYIKWNEKIDVSIQTLKIIKKKSDTKFKIDQKKLKKQLLFLSHYDEWFGNVVVEKVIIGDTIGSFVYHKNGFGYLNALSPSFEFKATLSKQRNISILHIKSLRVLKRNIYLRGDIFFDKNKFLLYSKLNLNVNNDLEANIFAKLSDKKLVYNLRSQKDIKSIKYLMESLNLPKGVKFWALDAIDMDHANIKSVKGFVDFNNLKDSLKNLQAKVILHNLNYTYNTKLDPVHTTLTNLEFKNGVLFIRPKNTYSYGQFLDKSWLKIDFTKKDELLTLHLLFDGILNKDMLGILKAYKIKLPFLQHNGKVKTNLKLEVSLRSLKVNAKGEFFTSKANFDYLGINADIYNASIKLNNYDINIHNMKVVYKDIATAKVDAIYNAHTSKGNIVFNIDKVDLANKKISLGKIPLKITYEMNPIQDKIYVDKSLWKYDKTTLTIDAITIPFNLNNLVLNLPTTLFNVPDLLTGYIAGNINLKRQQASLGVDILKFKYKNIQLNESNAHFEMLFDENLTIHSKNKISFSVGDEDVNLRNTTLEIDKDVFLIKNTYLDIDNLLSTKINSVYKIDKKINNIDLAYLRVKNNKSTIYLKKNLHFLLKHDSNSTTIYSDDLATKLRFNKYRWKLKLNSLDKIVENSKYLQDLKLGHGSATIYKYNNRQDINFYAKIPYDYKLLIINNKPVKQYLLNGKINNKKIEVNINKKINITINKDIIISMKNSAINIPEVIRLADNTNILDNNTSNNKTNLLLNANNIYFYLGSDRKILADNVQLQYHNKITTAQLKYKNATAGFKLKDNNFHLYGSKFNDKFMENIFSLSKFKGGELEFSVKGTLDDYAGAFYIKNTTVLEYKLLNNVLAFINTVPSLITFSLPGYNKNGLKVDTSYAKFHAKNGIFNISDFLVDSKEVDIIGKGVADIKNDKIDLNLNLKTDLGSSISKIPIVGYILLGKDCVSTTLHVSGKLSNPDVKSMIAKDIIVAPFNIIKRTLLLPFELFKSEDNNSK